MRLSLKAVLKGLTLAVCFGALTMQPVKAELDGPIRDQMEYLDFSEHMIREGLYPKSSHDVFNKNKRAFVHGIRNHSHPHIYEPDVYTWELAMAKHRKKLAQSQPIPIQTPMPAPITPAPMTPAPVLPAQPAPVTLTPIGPQAVMEIPAALPANSMAKMNKLLWRARARGLYPGRELRANQLKEKLVNHMNSLGTQQNIPALMPALPQGKAGDSFDTNY